MLEEARVGIVVPGPGDRGVVSSLVWVLGLDSPLQEQQLRIVTAEPIRLEVISPHPGQVALYHLRFSSGDLTQCQVCAYHK